MRVTENFLINLATDAAAKGRDRLAAVGEIAASGVAVNRPSENGVAWAEGTRADARKIMSTSRHSTIARAHERLTTADRSFQTVDDVLQRTIELATQMANGSYGPEQRKYAAIEVRSLRDSAIAAANVQDNNGEFVFAGAQGNKPPFNATGVYQGDAQTNVVETAEHQQQTITLPGTVFTAAAGVNVFDVMTRLAQSMDNNDPTAISNALPTLHTAIRVPATERAEEI